MQPTPSSLHIGEIMEYYGLEYIIAGMAFSFFMAALAGAYLVYRDKQTEWERNHKEKK